MKWVVGALLAGVVCLSASAEESSSAEVVDPIAQLAASVCDRRLVLLGELPSHGEAETFLAKATVVRHLVDRCDFDTVVFEAGIYDFIGVDRAIAAGRATQQQLDNAIGGFWATPELKDWRAWLLGQAQARKLAIAGMDDQPGRTAVFARDTLPSLVAQALPEERSQACAQTVERQLKWQYGADQPFDDAEKTRLQSCAAEAASGKTTPSQDAVMLRNLSRYVHRPPGRDGAEDRDRSMALNLERIVARRDDTSKIVVWTATVHAARRQGQRPFPPMAALLDDAMKRDMAAIGFTALRGESSMAGMPARELTELPADSLEAVATAPDRPTAWLDSRQLKELGSRTSRLFGRPTSADWSIHFDGVLVFRDERPPQPAR